jgi:hypothetical protein
MGNDIEKYFERTKILTAWDRFQRDRNTDFWDKDKFIQLLDNEQIIIDYEWFFDGDKTRLINCYSDTEKEKKREVLNRLREIYNERFGIIVTEDHTQFTNYERFELLKKLGIEDSALYKKLSNTGKHHLVGKILGIHKDNARKVIDGTYTAGGLDTEKIETFLTRFRQK